MGACHDKRAAEGGRGEQRPRQWHTYRRTHCHWVGSTIETYREDSVVVYLADDIRRHIVYPEALSPTHTHVERDRERETEKHTHARAHAHVRTHTPTVLNQRHIVDAPDVTHTQTTIPSLSHSLFSLSLALPLPLDPPPCLSLSCSLSGSGSPSPSLSLSLSTTFPCAQTHKASSPSSGAPKIAEEPMGISNMRLIRGCFRFPAIKYNLALAPRSDSHDLFVQTTTGLFRCAHP